MFQSPMLCSQSSMRLPMYSGTHSTFAFSSSSVGRISSTEMNQSSESRKMSGVSQRQQCGYACVYRPASTRKPVSPSRPMIWSAASVVERPCSHP